MADNDFKMLGWLFFSLRGRIGRWPFCLGFLLMVVILTMTLYQSGISGEGTTGQTAWAVAFLLLTLVSLWFSFTLAVKRFHDFGKPGALAVLMFVPMVSFFAFVFLCFAPGDTGANEYGEVTNSPA